jgi:methionyl-tRNA synthetase
MDFKRFLVTAALPYANGPVHIGHLAGCYLPADIYTRYQRAQKRDVKFVCGSDEHGVPITIRAMKEGITPQQVVDKYHAIIKDSFAAMGISCDIFSRTSSKSTAKRRRHFSKSCTMRASLKSGTASNTTMSRRTCSWPTDIL